MRPTWAEVDPSAIEANVAVVAAAVAPAAVCAVVKADGYGHGAVVAARAALAGGATWLAVALVEEADALRRAGIAAPVLLLSEPRPGEMADALALDVRPTVFSAVGIDAARAAVVASGRTTAWSVHLKIDTGMHRIGVAPADALERALAITADDALVLEGVWTHCAVADDPDDPFTDTQLDRFESTLATLAEAGVRPLLTHTANSAVALAHPRGRRDLVRVGIAAYGIAPSPALAAAAGLQPAMRLRSEVTSVTCVATGEGVSYGRRWRAERPTRVATVAIGYADGVRRRLFATGGEVLVRARRRPIVGVVTMDQLMIEAGDDVEVGDEVVLLGSQGDETISADEIAERLDTIAYEVVCDIGARVPRRSRTTDR
jgi:alanine racemase